MPDLAPWIAVAGLGALHGLNPVSGWMFAAAWGLHARDCTLARDALLPIALGHAASIVVAVALVVQGLSMDRPLVQAVSGMLLIGVACWRTLRGGRRIQAVSARWGHAGMAVWSFLSGTAHGAGLMLIPALMPLCLTADTTRAVSPSGMLPVALAAVAVHAAAMLVTMGGVATLACRRLALQRGLLASAQLRQTWTGTLAVAGFCLLATAR